MEKVNMLKTLLLLLMNLVLAGMATAQTNLVPNGTFEDTVDCDLSMPSSLLKARHWYNPNIATPDVWDCDLDRLCGMGMSPASTTYQPSFEGIRHAGGYYWYGPGSSSTRDYLGVRLAEPLISGVAYEVSMQVVRRRWEFAIDHIGVWFGADSLSENTGGWLHVTPQLKLRDPASEYLTEGDEWTLLKDTLVAAGGEAWMVIGNFDVADSVNGIQVMDPAPSYAYYFIDDVAVREIDQVNGTTENVRAWWNGSGLNLQWSMEHRPERIVVFDPLGRPLVDNAADSSELGKVIPFAEASAGLYVVHVVGGQHRSVVKVIKGEG